MKILLLTMILGGLCAAAACQGGTAKQDEEGDLARIEELHRTDIAASKAQDFDALKTLWTEDAVKLAPDERGTIGREAIVADMDKYREAQVNLEILEYRHDWQEIRLMGDWAFEWGYFYGRARDRTTGEEFEERNKLLRILRKQSDGSWKVARVMWNGLQEE